MPAITAGKHLEVHRTIYKYQFPGRPPLFSFRTLALRYSLLQTAERARMREPEVLRAFPWEQRHRLHVGSWLKRAVALLPSIMLPGPSRAQLGSVFHGSASSKE